VGSCCSITYLVRDLPARGGADDGPVVALNLGGIVGTAFWGQLSETRLGRRGAGSLAAMLGIAMIPMYLYAAGTTTLWLGALLMGACGHGAWGIVPSYLSERFPTTVRSGGSGFAYHAGAALGAVTPTLLGWLQDGGTPLADAMAAGIGVSGVLIAVMVWIGPETRGRQLD
jgi:SHS family lactate transporter-like MFS transporter